MDKLDNQLCPFCGKKKLTLIEDEKDIPYFGKAYLFSMNCGNCKYDKADVEFAENKGPKKYTLEINSEKDMKIRVVKSSSASVKIPQMRLSVTPGPGSVGYISNVEGVLDKFKKVIEGERDSTDDSDVRKKAKNLLKKLWKVKLGDVKIKLIIEDPKGNSAIISEKAKVEVLK